MEKFEIEAAPLEIERKFLIEYPDISELRKMPDYKVEHMAQTYLLQSEDFVGGRLRRIEAESGVRYVYTYKVRLSDMTRREYEREIDEQEYRSLMERKNPLASSIIKDRHSFSYMGLTYELDVYSFWDDKATLEAEVDSESARIPIPPCVKLIKDVTDDRRYNNSKLAMNHGMID